MKSQEKRLEELIEIRKKIKNTDFLKYKDNEEKIKVSMNNFLHDGQGCTLRLWMNDKQNTRIVLILTNNEKRQSGISIETI